MEKSKLLGMGLDMDKIERLQSLIAGATFLYNGIKNIKESPKVSIAKSILGGYLIYTAITDKHPAGKSIEKLVA